MFLSDCGLGGWKVSITNNTRHCFCMSVISDSNIYVWAYIMGQRMFHFHLAAEHNMTLVVQCIYGILYILIVSQRLTVSTVNCIHCYSHLPYEVEGNKGFRMKFYLKGQRRTATVHLDARQVSISLNSSCSKYFNQNASISEFKLKCFISWNK